VIVEALILDGQKCAQHVRRDLIEWNVDALFFEDRERQRVVRVVHRSRLIHFADAANGIQVR
jgi:hypothetical protein